MPRPRYQHIDPEKKTRLLEAATKEFAAHGYELASINRILEAAGLSKSSFYYYFDDKADLAATVLIAHAEPMTRLGELRQPDSPEAFWAELRRVSLVQLRELESKRTVYECLTRLSNALAKDPELAGRVLPLFAPQRHAMVGLFQTGVEVGALRGDLPVPMLISLIQSVKTAAYAAHFPGDRVPTEAEMETFTDLIFDLARRICSPSKGSKP